MGQSSTRPIRASVPPIHAFEQELSRLFPSGRTSSARILKSVGTKALGGGRCSEGLMAGGSLHSRISSGLSGSSLWSVPYLQKRNTRVDQ
jgi:hypothetical protein